MEDHSSEVQVVKHLLHILSHPSPAPPTSCAGQAWPSSESTPNAYALEFMEHTGSVEGLPGAKDGPGEFLCSFLHGNSTAIKVTGFCAFHQRSSYMGRCEESTGMTKGKDVLTFSMIRLGSNTFA